MYTTFSRPSGSKASDPKEWEKAVANCQRLLQHTAVSHLNLELMNAHAAASWQTHLNNLSRTKERLVCSFNSWFVFCLTYNKCLISAEIIFIFLKGGCDWVFMTLKVNLHLWITFVYGVYTHARTHSRLVLTRSYVHYNTNVYSIYARRVREMLKLLLASPVLHMRNACIFPCIPL